MDFLHLCVIKLITKHSNADSVYTFFLVCSLRHFVPNDAHKHTQQARHGAYLLCHWFNRRAFTLG